MRAFVTGATGAVGREFLPRLLAQGWTVTALTRDAGRPELPRHERLTYLEADLGDAAAAEHLLAKPPAHDVTFHLAASLDYFGPLDRLLATNAGGTALMARLASRAGARRFVYASSVEAAGAFGLGEIPAPAHRVHPPLTAYGASKRAAEAHVLALEREGVSSICLRIGNVYGPGWSNFVVEFANALLRRGMLWEYLPLYGERYWSPVWNEDVAEGLIAAASGTQTGIENLVGQAATVEEMFHLCAAAMEVPFSSGRRKASDWFHVSLQAHLQRWFGVGGTGAFGYLLAPAWPRVHRCCGMEESSRRLGWRPRMPLREGIRRTLLWAREAGLIRFGHEP